MKRWLMVAAALGVVAIAGAQWVRVADAPEARSRAAGAIIGANFYYVGGESMDGRNLSAWVYEVPTNTWRTIAPLPAVPGGGGVSNVDAAAYAGKVYLPGGYTGTVGIDRLLAYNTLTDSWATLAPMPGPRYGYSAVTLNNYLYVVGGTDGEVVQNTLFRYDLANNVWASLNPMGTAREYAGAAVINGKIYVAGGIDPSAAAEYDTVEVYDPASNSWSYLDSMEAARGGPAMFNFNGDPYVVGGGFTSYLSSTELYRSGAWQPGYALNVGRRTMAYDGNGIWMVTAGGYDGDYSNVTEVHAVPEPATLAVVGLGLLALLKRTRK